MFNFEYIGKNMSFKELIKVGNYYQEKYFNKYSEFGGVKSEEEAPFRLLLDDFGIKIFDLFSPKELEIFNPNNVERS